MQYAKMQKILSLQIILAYFLILRRK